MELKQIEDEALRMTKKEQNWHRNCCSVWMPIRK